MQKNNMISPFAKKNGFSVTSLQIDLNHVQSLTSLDKESLDIRSGHLTVCKDNGDSANTFNFVREGSELFQF